MEERDGLYPKVVQALLLKPKTGGPRLPELDCLNGDYALGCVATL